MNDILALLIWYSEQVFYIMAGLTLGYIVARQFKRPTKYSLRKKLWK